jgi:hypothetical protein
LTFTGRLFLMKVPVKIIALASEVVLAIQLHAQSTQAAAYINKAIDIMEQNSLHKKSIVWPTLKKEALFQCKNCESTGDTYPVIRECIRRLGDHHSFFQAPNPQTGRVSSLVENNIPEGNLERLGHTVAAHITIPTYLGAEKDSKVFAVKL